MSDTGNRAVFYSPDAFNESEETHRDRKASEIDVPSLSQDELRALTDTELRRCMNGAESRSRMPGLRGSNGNKDYRKLLAEFKRRHPGRKPPRWRSLPPPPPNSK
ncbi:hypothetical protein GF391_03755 [Candidatus Uhrbacteria bacterium]|nr:hypothetical protein [Candidatus Uhrbacteria bacterium]